MSSGNPPGLGQPPPPYSGPPPPYAPPQGMPYPGGPNPGVAAPVGYAPPSGAPLYPDLSQLPQPEAGTVSHGGFWYSPCMPHPPLHDVSRDISQAYPSVTHYPVNTPLPAVTHNLAAIYNPANSSQPPIFCLEKGQAKSVHATPWHSTEVSSAPSLSQSPPPPYVPYEVVPTTVNPYGAPGTPYQGAPSYPGEPLSPSAPPHEGDKPVRPAPPPPTCPTSTPAATPNQPDQNQLGSPGQPQRPPRQRDNEASTGLGVSWQGAAGLRLYFLPQEGQVVCHHKLLSLTIYKKIGNTGAQVEEGLLGMVDVPGCWSLKLKERETYVLHAHPNTYVFLDHSTQPQRVVVLVLPEDISTTMLQDLMVLLQEMTQLRDEKEARTVDKLTTGVSTVYTDLTKKLNTAVRDKVPGAHANTKWLRKGAGSVVRLGGSLVAKGANLIADQVTPQQEEESPDHCHLMEMMATLRKKLAANEITYV